jgi:hypothetical protein
MLPVLATVSKITRTWAECQQIYGLLLAEGAHVFVSGSSLLTCGCAHAWVCVLCVCMWAMFRMYFCSMFIVFVVSEYYVYLQGFMKVCCICGGMCKNVRVQMHMCVICMCRWSIGVMCTCVLFVVYEGANKYCMWYVFVYVVCYVCMQGAGVMCIWVVYWYIYVYDKLWVVCLWWYV